MREKACIVCGTRFTPLKQMQKACGAECAIKYAIDKRDRKRAQTERLAKAEARKVIKLRKEAVKSRAQWLREAQAAVNAYVRLRDEAQPCISCGRHHQGQWHAGHYRSVGSSPALRFDLANLHKQCQPCNTHLHGNLIEYRVNLIRKIGQAEVDRLEGPQEPKKYLIEDLKQIISTYKQKSKELKDGRG